jgi:hypothetical protein
MLVGRLRRRDEVVTPMAMDGVHDSGRLVDYDFSGVWFLIATAHIGESKWSRLVFGYLEVVLYKY